MEAFLFRFGTRTVRVCSGDRDFGARFAANFHDCLLPGGAYAGDALTLHVDAARHDVVEARLEPAAAGIEPGAFERLFPEHGFVVDHDTLRATAGPCTGARIVIDGHRLRIDRRLPWQLLLGHFLVHRAMALQPEFLFLHAASASLGSRGILLCGDKGAGKSTLSLAMAARGHGFLGDEIAVVDPAGRRLLPFRRRASVRPGPQGARVAHWLSSNPIEPDVMPDGTVRARVQVSEMFADAGGHPVPLSAAFFLGARQPQPSARRVDFELHDLPSVSPLDATMSSRPPASRAITFLLLFRSVPCFGLHPGGTPDDTVDLIEATLESSWATA